MSDNEVPVQEQPPKVVDLDLWKRQRDDVKQLQKAIANGLEDNPNKLVNQLNTLMETTSSVLDALINDFAKMTMVLQETQEKGAAVAQQSYLCLEVMEKKGLATKAEMKEIYDDMMQEQMEAIKAQAEAQQEFQQRMAEEMQKQNTTQGKNEPGGLVIDPDQPLS